MSDRGLTSLGRSADLVARALRLSAALAAALTTAGAGLHLALAPAARAMSSPWWEDYAIKERFLCGGQGAVVVERNDAQASLISGGFRTTLFREPSDEPGLRYRGDDLRLILQGDELTVERLPKRIQCLRTEQV
ncbi:hypothetical protein [Vulcanococcus limneticus]|uniref:hypothetical protein n=1 Tax=Vulcanococcus limneticus TaxID=2170428 RepID=UPI00398BE236